MNGLDIQIDLEDVDGDVAIAVVQTPVGTLQVVARFVTVGDTLRVEDAHVQGLSRGVLGRRGLNAIGRAVLEAMNVRQVCIFGGVRTTGTRPGSRPPPFRFPRRR